MFVLLLVWILALIGILVFTGKKIYYYSLKSDEYENLKLSSKELLDLWVYYIEKRDQWTSIQNWSTFWYCIIGIPLLICVAFA